jgi:hypothetical protein
MSKFNTKIEEFAYMRFIIPKSAWGVLGMFFL